MSIPRPNGRGAIDRIAIPCGKCPACLSNKRKSWAFRLSQELKQAETASFITLTYCDDKNVGSLSKSDVNLFIKRLRQNCIKVDIRDGLYGDSGLKGTEKLKMRYFLTGEYGSNTFRPHYHMLLFNHPVLPEMELYELIGKSWKNGSCHIGTVTEASIAYVAKYLLKGSVTPKDCAEPFSFMSKRPGIGVDYISRLSDWHQDDYRNYVVKSGGIKQIMPRYYKDKIFSKTDKQEIEIRNRKFMDESEEMSLLQKIDLERKHKNLFKNDKI